eukprot:14842349-Ditylum_brightwellii.AAC.1
MFDDADKAQREANTLQGQIDLNWKVYKACRAFYDICQKALGHYKQKKEWGLMKPRKELQTAIETLLNLCLNLDDFKVEDFVEIDDNEEGEENENENRNENKNGAGE